MLLGVGGLIASGYRGGGEADWRAFRVTFDQNLFHLRAVERFASQWPAFDFRDYESATTPGYHVALAAAHRLMGGGVLIDAAGGAAAPSAQRLRWVGLFAAVGLAIALGLALARLATPGTAIALALPVLVSPFVLQSAGWLLPDAAGWWGVAAVLGLAFSRRFGVASLTLAAAVLVLTVCVRQAHLWLAGVIVLWAYFAAFSPRTEPANAAPCVGPGPRWAFMPPLGDGRAAIARAALALLFTLPAVAVLALFARQWGGLTPPAFSPAGSELAREVLRSGVAQPGDYTAVSGRSPASLPFILALFGLFSVFFAGYLWPTIRRGGWAAPAALAAALAGLVGLMPATNYQLKERIGGLWALANRAPMVLDRSPLIVLLAMFGAAMLVLWWRALPPRQRWIMLSALSCFTAAICAQALSWQRYIDPFLLVLLSLCAATVAGGWRDESDGDSPSPDSPTDRQGESNAGAPARPPAWAVLGPIALAAAMLALTITTLR